MKSQQSEMTLLNDEDIENLTILYDFYNTICMIHEKKLDKTKLHAFISEFNKVINEKYSDFEYLIKRIFNKSIKLNDEMIQMVEIMSYYISVNNSGKLNVDFLIHINLPPSNPSNKELIFV